MDVSVFVHHVGTGAKYFACGKTDHELTLRGVYERLEQVRCAKVVNLQGMQCIMENPMHPNHSSSMDNDLGAFYDVSYLFSVQDIPNYGSDMRMPLEARIRPSVMFKVLIEKSYFIMFCKPLSEACCNKSAPTSDKDLATLNHWTVLLVRVLSENGTYTLGECELCARRERLRSKCLQNSTDAIAPTSPAMEPSP